MNPSHKLHLGRWPSHQDLAISRTPCRRRRRRRRFDCWPKSFVLKTLFNTNSSPSGLVQLATQPKTMVETQGAPRDLTSFPSVTNGCRNTVLEKVGFGSRHSFGSSMSVVDTLNPDGSLEVISIGWSRTATSSSTSPLRLFGTFPRNSRIVWSIVVSRVHSLHLIYGADPRYVQLSSHLIFSTWKSDSKNQHHQNQKPD